MRRNRAPFLILLGLILPLSSPLFCCSKSAASLSDPLEKDVKEAQIKKLEADLMREREQYLKYGSEEENLLEQLTLLEKGIEDQRKLLDELKETIRSQKKELKRLRRREKATRTPYRLAA